MSSPVVISFYTPDWEYQDRALALAKQCDEYGLNHDFRLMNSVGSWIRNTAIKASFIYQMAQEYEHVIWLDCDGTLKQRPSLVLEHPVREPIMCVPHQTLPRNWHVAAISVRQTPESLALLARWAQFTRVNDVTDELAFHEVTTIMSGLVAPLPTSYCSIPDRGIYAPETVYAVGLSKSPDKMAMKAKIAQREQGAAK